MRYRFIGLILGAMALLGVQAPAFAQPANISMTVGVCSPKFPKQCALVGADGSLPISGSISATTSARATNAAPSYVEGSLNSLSMDLSGNLRTTGGGGGGGGATVTATTAAPSYINNSTDNPLSSNLTGDLRVIAKQNGTWNIDTITTISDPVAVTGTFWQATQPVSGTVAATQSGTWNVGTVTTLTNPAGIKGADGSTITSNSNPVPISDAGSSITVDGTVAVTGVSTAANQATEISSLSTIATNGTTLNTAFGTTAATAYTGTGTVAMGYLRAIADAAISTAVAATNVSQINGVTPLMGAGATGTGSQRVTIASDSPSLGSTGATVPTAAAFAGANSAGLLTGIIQADVSVPISASTATTTQLIALSSGKKIYITAWDVLAAGTGNIKLVYGTGTNCGTGTTDLTGNYNLTAQSGLTKGGGLGPVLVVPASQALCVTTSAAVGMYGSVAATQF